MPRLKSKSTARLIYEALLGTPSDELSAYIFEDVMRAYVNVQPAPFSEFFACKLLQHVDKKPLAAFTLKDVQLCSDTELVLEELKGSCKAGIFNKSSQRPLPFMPCFDAFISEGGLLMAFRGLWKFAEEDVWSGDQLSRLGKLCRLSLWRNLEEYGIPLQKIAENTIKASRWWREELIAVETHSPNHKEHRGVSYGGYQQSPKYADCRRAPSAAYVGLECCLGKDRIR